MSPSCWSTFPPDPNQARPLCANDGHALLNTKITMPAISTSSEQASTPSTRSVRLSLHGLDRVAARRDAALLPDPLPAGAAI